MTARGCAILITGQNYDAIENLADNIAILQSGKIIFSGPIVKLVQAFPVYVRIVTDDHREIAVQFQKLNLILPEYTASFANQVNRPAP